MKTGINAAFRVGLGDGPTVDFMTVLSFEECVRELKRGAQRFNDRWLAVHMNGVCAQIVATTPPNRDGGAWTWLYRFNGRLTQTSFGTHVIGDVERNVRLEIGLALPGALMIAFAITGVVFGMMTLAWFAALMVLILGGLFLYYERLIMRRKRELTTGIENWLMKPAAKPQ